MTAEEVRRLQRVKELFELAAGAATSDRPALLRRECDGDSALLGEVEELLSLREETGLVLDRRPLSRGAISAGAILAGRYRVIRPLAAGGMGEIFEGEDTSTGARVALKFIRRMPGAMAEDRLLARFHREIRLSQTIGHPNVCRTLDVGEHEGEPFCVMEFLEGETLAERLERDGRLTPEQALPVANQICDGLTAAHAAGVVHRDLKPGNILLAGGRAVIIDFGLAALYRRDTSLTAAGEVIGTLAYMAPEQLEEGEASPASDVYALGVVLYEMLTGEKPHAARSPFRLAAQKARESHRTPRLNPSGMPGVWEDVIGRCLKADPRQRFQSAAAVRDALARGRPSVTYILRRPAVMAAATLLLAAAIGIPAWRWWNKEYVPRAAAVHWYQEGQAALAEAAPLRAAQLLARAVEADPEFIEARALLASAYADVDQPDKARETLLEATSVADRRWRLGRNEAASLHAARAAVVRDFAAAAERYQALAAASAGAARSYARLSAARMSEQSGDLDSALKTLTELTAGDAENSPALVKLGILLARQRQPDAARAALTKAERTYRTSGNLEGRSDLLLARVQANVQDLAADRRDLEEVLRLSQRTANRYHQLTARFRMANIMEREGNYEGAVALARQAADEARRENMPEVAARAMGEFGYAFVFLKQPRRAAEILTDAVDLAERAHNPATLASNRMRLGEAEFINRQIEAAYRTMAPAIAWYRQSGPPQQLPMMLIKWGTVVGGLPNRWAESEQVFREALERARRDGNRTHESIALQRLASQFAYRDLRRAAEYWDQTVAIGRKTHYVGPFFQAAAAYSRWGRFEQAERLLAEGDRESQANDPPFDRAHHRAYGAAQRAWLALYRADCDTARQQIDIAAGGEPGHWDEDRHTIQTCDGKPHPDSRRWLEQRAAAQKEAPFNAARLYLAAARLALVEKDRARTLHLAARGRDLARTVGATALDLEASLLDFAANGAPQQASAGILELARSVGFDPPEAFGGRRDLLQLWTRR